MSTPVSNTHPLLKIINNRIVSLPTPTRITALWNWGSIIGLCLIIQIITGVFLSIQYIRDNTLAFESVVQISSDINYGWWLRRVHANGASLFFLAIYCHIGRGLYFGSYYLPQTWWRGRLLLFILIATAFLGYVLPWGQISFWGATVITNLISAIPYGGQTIVYWLWGGFSVGGSTLTRFFTLHFILPLLITVFIILHLLNLHETGSNNTTGLNSNLDKIPFHPYFSSKDTVGWVVSVVVLLLVSITTPWFLGDAENFLMANPIVTPVHIKPEWYFLFAYAILRSIPNKLGGVVALVLSVAILFISPLFKAHLRCNTPTRKMLFWLFISSFIILTWVGGKAVEDPYITIGQITSVLYFILFVSHNRL